jgi:hypothetical protein
MGGNCRSLCPNPFKIVRTIAVSDRCVKNVKIVRSVGDMTVNRYF